MPLANDLILSQLHLTSSLVVCFTVIKGATNTPPRENAYNQSIFDDEQSIFSWRKARRESGDFGFAPPEVFLPLYGMSLERPNTVRVKPTHLTITLDRVSPADHTSLTGTTQEEPQAETHTDLDSLYGLWWGFSIMEENTTQAHQEMWGRFAN
jgi:hypothetical protein